jgi:hypothetical protein
LVGTGLTIGLVWAAQSVDFDNAHENTKYVLLQLMHERMATPLGQQLAQAGTMRELWYALAPRGR